jgi:hypothetical protein
MSELSRSAVASQERCKRLWAQVLSEVRRRL